MTAVAPGRYHLSPAELSPWQLVRLTTSTGLSGTAGSMLSWLLARVWPDEDSGRWVTKDPISTAAIGRDLGLTSSRHVRRVMAALESDGLVVRHYAPDRGRPNRYELRLDAVQRAARAVFDKTREAVRRLSPLAAPTARGLEDPVVVADRMGRAAAAALGPELVAAYDVRPRQLCAIWRRWSRDRQGALAELEVAWRARWEAIAVLLRAGPRTWALLRREDPGTWSSWVDRLGRRQRLFSRATWPARAEAALEVAPLVRARLEAAAAPAPPPVDPDRAIRGWVLISQLDGAPVPSVVAAEGLQATLAARLASWAPRAVAEWVSAAELELEGGRMVIDLVDGGQVARWLAAHAVCELRALGVRLALRVPALGPPT